MSGSDDELRRQLTFRQAEGLAPIPTQLAGHAVTQKTRIYLFALLDEVDGGQGSRNLVPLWTDFFEKFPDELPFFPNERRAFLKDYIQTSSGDQIFELMQFLARSRLISTSQYNGLKNLCISQQLPYRFHGTFGLVADRPTLFPVSSPEQADAFAFDYAALKSQSGSRTHLKAASSALSRGDYAGSVRESIHAVESAAKNTSGESGSTLSGALRLIEKQKPLHPAFKQALEKLYAWTSDEKGVRHALLNESTGVTEDQAIFMLSACAAFSAWLARQGQSEA
ncbi:MAG: hypothetical protein HYU62_12665 [Caulobacterales bacterium]|nr:hypothetical protein [Caulobacterales bacterium]